MTLSSIERAVASHAGLSAEQVAIAVGCSLPQVHAARRRLGRNIHDGQPGRASHAAVLDEDIDFEIMVRGNQGIL